METVRIYTDHEATDEAVLMLVRKLHRLYPDAHAALMAKLPTGARDALTMADNRADYLRTIDMRDGITHEYAPLWEDETD